MTFFNGHIFPLFASQVGSSLNQRLTLWNNFHKNEIKGHFFKVLNGLGSHQNDFC